MRPLLASLRPRLDAVTLALSLVLFAAAVGAQMVADRRAVMDRVVAVAESDSRLISEHANVVFSTASRVLDGIVRSAGDRPLAEIAESEAMREALAEAATYLIEGGTIGILDRDGTLMLTSLPSAPIGSRFADHEFFQAVAASTPYSIGHVASGRNTGRPIVVLAKPIGSGESFRGAVTVGIPARYFSEFYASISLGPQSTVAMVRDDGLLLVREPPHTGMALAEITLPAGTDRSVSIGPSSMDGTERVSAMRRVPGQPLIVTAALSSEVVLAPWRNRSIVLGGVAALALCLLAMMGAMATRTAHKQQAALDQASQLSQRLAAALGREQMMRSELTHRTKNNLAMMIAMLKVEGRRPNTGRDAFLASANRIGALALAQQELSRAEGGDIDCASYLRNIATALVEAEPDRKVKLHLALESVPLPPQRAQALGLIANELTTNSIKYAFANRASGTITMTLRTAANDVLFDYADDGPGFNSNRRVGSQGLHLISALCETLRAQYTMSGVAGAHFTLSMPRTGAAPGEPETAAAAVAPVSRRRG